MVLRRSSRMTFTFFPGELVHDQEQHCDGDALGNELLVREAGLLADMHEVVLDVGQGPQRSDGREA